MTAGVGLRPLRRGDLDAVTALERRHGQGSWTRVVAHGGVMLVGDEAHVTTLAVDADLRRRGVATRLVRALLRAAADRGAVAATLEVRRSNEAARALYRRLGFEPAGVRPRYHPATGEDAIVMWRRGLPGTGPFK